MLFDSGSNNLGAFYCFRIAYDGVENKRIVMDFLLKAKGFCQWCARSLAVKCLSILCIACALKTGLKAHCSNFLLKVNELWFEEFV